MPPRIAPAGRSVALTGIPPVAFTVHKVEAVAEAPGCRSASVTIEQGMEDGGLSLEFDVFGLSFSGSKERGVQLTCEDGDANVIRALAGALLGALAAAERAGVIEAVRP